MAKGGLGVLKIAVKIDTSVTAFVRRDGVTQSGMRADKVGSFTITKPIRMS